MENVQSEKFSQLLAAAEAGDIAAMKAVAECYRVGDGVEQSLRKTVDWLERSGETQIVLDIPNAGEGGKHIPGKRHDFFQCQSLVAVHLPEEVRCIADDMFFRCSALRQINLDNIYMVGKDALVNCAIETVTIRPKEVMPGKGFVLINIFESAFGGCRALREVTIGGDNCEARCRIDRAAFGSCTSLERITLDLKVIALGSAVFQGCEALKEIIIPKGTLEYYQKLFGKKDDTLPSRMWDNAAFTDKLKEAEE